MLQEIAEQPAAVADTLRALGSPAEALASSMQARDVDRIVLIARGSSDHAAVYGRYLLEGRCGLVTALAAPSLYTTYAAPVDLRGALAIGVSQSGATPEIVSALAYAGSRGALTAGITNDPRSPLARSADHPLVTRAGDERSVAATKTFTAQLAAFAALAAALGGGLGRGVLVRRPAARPDCRRYQGDAGDRVPRRGRPGAGHRAARGRAPGARGAAPLDRRGPPVADREPGVRGARALHAGDPGPARRRATRALARARSRSAAWTQQGH
jgi:hypothetical protein